ncbi:histidine phosphatase family protein [Limnobacter parvus]|uniref:Histidine phosphatase family protein n=1 Tax=Limnobacter parvus TaxID=2939690 RepID=A0ABT1XJ07_9BURK|nr:histidine phosphatase family protein [Limnobacter parvus]MCR2747261.1 histidine phosphatase family protein [Limnobacter parvus]
MLYRIASIAALSMLAVLPAISAAQTGSDPWEIWKQPGVHAIMRHATAPGYGDPDGFTLGQCSTQRDLNKTGREEARSLGNAIRSKGIKLTAVYSSQWCRCLHTAKELNLGKAQELPALNSFFQGRGSSAEQTAALKEHLATLNPDDKVLYVSHQVNTTALTGIYPNSGEVVLFKFSPKGQVTVLGRVQAEKTSK